MKRGPARKEGIPEGGEWGWSVWIPDLIYRMLSSVSSMRSQIDVEIAAMGT
jgi:hypothetical protein